jgi:hypothetical protein
MKNAAMLKTINSLPALRELLLAANRRYLEFLSAIEEDTTGTHKLNKISQAVEENGRSYRGEFNISGFQSKNLRYRLPGKTSGQI